MKKEYKNNDIIHTDNLIEDLKKILSKYKDEKKIILTDDNCKKLCLPIIEEILDDNFEIYEITSGEKNKSIDTVKEIWGFLISKNIDRQSLMINLGGGMVTDIGGFVASTFKRGISFINIPTTLLAQTDASVGGKTGINFGGLKNEIGVFKQADQIIISTIFLKTLSNSEFLSGFAEMIKHALIYNESHLNELFDYYGNDFKKNILSSIKDLIIKSIKIKNRFIKNDIYDKGIRKILNFGHTFGHAFESHFNTKEKLKLKHGEAVAHGMICELFISSEKLNLEEKILMNTCSLLKETFGTLYIDTEEFDKIYTYMKHDKKNSKNEINCVLLESIGNAKIDQKISKKEIINSLNFLNKLSNNF